MPRLRVKICCMISRNEAPHTAAHGADRAVREGRMPSGTGCAPAVQLLRDVAPEVPYAMKAGPAPGFPARRRGLADAGRAAAHLRCVGTDASMDARQAARLDLTKPTGFVAGVEEAA